MSGWISDWQLDWPLQWHGFEQSAEVDGYGDGGVATLVLDLEGLTVTHSWVTDVIKFKAGNEQRISRNDIDRQRYSGSVLMSTARARDTRALMARYAAIGSRFLLGMPHEALTLADDASGDVVPVSTGDMALCDWAVPGQRVVVTGRTADTDEAIGIDAVVQSAGPDSITLDVDVSALGIYGSEIMPAQAIYLEPQQAFPRYESDVESWNLNARAASPLDSPPGLASLELPGIFADLIAYAREYGLVGNLRSIEVAAHPGAPDEGLLSETGGGVFTLFRFKTGVTTVQDFIDAMEAANYIRIGGTAANPSATLTGGIDDFIDVLSGGTDSGAVGTGATLTTYDGDPVWTRPISVNGTNEDGLHAMTQMIDHGGIPAALGTADRADWYRAVAIQGGDRAEWQWFKLFMSTVRGRQKRFWLSSWRADLEYVSHSGDELTIDLTAGDFNAWWPSQRQHVQIEQADGTVTYAEIEAAAGGVLTLSESLSGSAVTCISWLELCRFEDADEYTTTHGQHGFSVQLVARVVP